LTENYDISLSIFNYQPMSYKVAKFATVVNLTLVVTMLCSSLQLEAQSVKGLQKTLSAQIPEGNVPIIKPEAQNISIANGSFSDASGRTMFLRGINLGGSTKVPFSPSMGSHVREGFFYGKEISFIGRPFPIEDADQHFQRLKAWGFDFLRFLVTWEAIEHEGPGIYDTEYLDYLRTIISKAGEYGINVIIDPHQDVWSRYTGGDGAPLWTFEVAGMDVTKFQETGAAIVHNVYGDPFPKMIWYTNYFKLGAATMFTLFFGGNDFAPKTLVDGKPIQEYLQEHYINALLQVAETVKDLPNVIGFELMNEPSAGFIGIENIAEPYHTDIMGDAPTPYQGILLGEGIPQSIQNYRMGIAALKKNGQHIVNEQKLSVWKNNQSGIWMQNDVWKICDNGSPELLDSAYFSKVKGEKVDFNKMYYQPFAQKYAQSILAINPNWIICVDNVLFPYPQELPELKKIENVKWINGSHWYDDVTLAKKKYLPFLGLDDGKVVFGKNNVRKAFENRLALMIDETHQQFGNVPSLLGEFGIPFDMNKAKAYKTGNYSKQIKALNRCFQVAETNLLNYTLWNYTADNTNERGDLWNGEDLSVFSLSQQISRSDINSGGRALEAVIRPYPKKIAGKLIEYNYNYKNKTLTVNFELEEVSEFPTEIFVPEYIYGDSFIVFTDGGKLSFDKKEQILMYYPNNKGSHSIILKSK
jgi:hypothetical protein